MGIVKNIKKNKWMFRGLIISGFSLVLVVAIFFTIIFPFRISIEKTNSWISVSLIQNIVYAATSTGYPTSNTNGSLPWTNPTNAYTSNNAYATVSPTYGATTSKNPTVNTNGLFPWTNPSNAYTSEGSYATTSTLQTLTIYPDGSDGDPDSNTCNAAYSTGTTFWGVVDEVSASDADYYTMVTNGGGRLTMTFTAPTTSALPPDAVIQSIVVNYRGNNSGSASFRPSMKIGSNYYDTLGTSRDPSAFTTYNDTLTTNPGTSAAWQASEINRTGGTSANYLNAFGTAGVDNNPDNQISWINLTVNFWYKDQVYGTFGITDPGTTSTITKVEIGYEAFATATQKLNLFTSADGGSTWSSAHLTGDLGTSDPGSYTYVDVTADQTWTWTLLNDSNFKIKVASYWVNGTPTWSIDALVVRVTYDDRRQYDHIWGTFGISGSGTITQVQIGYEAFATATGKFDIYTSSNGGSSWYTVHTTANLGTTDPGTYTYVDVTADTTWTWTLLNDTNFRVKFLTNYVSGTPAWSLDSIELNITFTPAEPDISVSPLSYDFGVVALSGTPSTATNYFTITNNSGGETDQTISVTTSSWSGGIGWTHSDTATAGANQAGLLANRGGTWGVGDIIIKYTTPNFIYENCPALTGYSFGIKLNAPTSVGDGVQKSITVRVTATGA